MKARIKLGLDEADVRRWLDNGRLPEALLVVAHLAALPPALVLAAQASKSPKEMTLVVRCADLSAAMLSRILCASPHHRQDRNFGRMLALLKTTSAAQARRLLVKEAGAEEAEG